MGNMKKHFKAVHEGLKDIDKCELCGESFAKGYLNQHIKTIHENRKDFKCDYCGKLFADHGNMKKHIRALHELHKQKIIKQRSVPPLNT